MTIYMLQLCTGTSNVRFRWWMCSILRGWREIFSESRTVQDVTSALAKLCSPLQGSVTVLVVIKVTSGFSSKDLRKKYLSKGKIKPSQTFLRDPKRKLSIKSSVIHCEEVLGRMQPRLSP